MPDTKSADAGERYRKALEARTIKWLVEQVVPDLNNMVRALEDEGDRVYLGSTNDADDLKKIAQRLDGFRAALEGTTDA